MSDIAKRAHISIRSTLLHLRAPRHSSSVRPDRLHRAPPLISYAFFLCDAILQQHKNRPLVFLRQSAQTALNFLENLFMSARSAY